MIFQSIANSAHPSNHGICGYRIPTLFVFRNPKHYSIETTNYAISHRNIPKNNWNGDSIYKIMINGETFHAVINTTPTKFMDAMLYLSDQFYDIICTFWELITCISNENHEQSRWLNQNIITYCSWIYINFVCSKEQEKASRGLCQFFSISGNT